MLDQLKVGGKMLIPIGPENSDIGQVLVSVERIQVDSGDMDADFVATDLMGVRFVPLVGDN